MAQIARTNTVPIRFITKSTVHSCFADFQSAASGFGANAMRQITQNQNDLMVSSANSSAQISLLDQQASNDVAAGNATAAGDTLNTLGKLVKPGSSS